MEVAESALQLQRFLLRRAWGVLYAAWAVSIFMTLFAIPIVVALLRVSAEFTVPAEIVLGLLSSGAAVVVTLRAFKLVRETAEIRDLITKGTWEARFLVNSVLVPVWVTIYVVFISSIFLFGPKQVVFLLVIIYAAIAASFSYGLRLSFPQNLPVEGTAALSSFGIANAGSIITFLFVRTPIIYGILWGFTIAVLLLCAWYARTRRPPIVVEDHPL
jgi:hypothetical protein